MVRIGALALMIVAFFLLLGCSDKTTGNEETGVSITFANCLEFNALVFIDDDYKGSFSSERPAVIELSAGSHSLWAKSNATVHLPDTFFCWTENFSVASGKVTDLVLDCYGHGCR